MEKEILALIVLCQMLATSLGWFYNGPQIPPPRPLVLYQPLTKVVSSKQYQNAIGGGLQIVKPPDLSSEFQPMVDFRKPKTQSFFKAVLLPPESPLYEFGYKVHDPKEMNYQQKSETRVGDAVKGFYSVLEPNGYVRMVKYQSDENGFRTQVSHHHADENGAGYSFSMMRH